MSNNIFSTTLDNGLTVVGEFQPYQSSCSIGILVNTGARDETPTEDGISHFLEHMMFKGSEKRSAKQVNDRLGELGAQANAYTSDENTVYYGTVLTEYQNEFLELLSDMLRPKLDSDEFDMEKKVILEEIALYEDKPQSFFIKESFKDYFKGTSLGYSILGSNATVSALTREQMLDYFNRRYCPDNMVLSIAGNFNWENFVSEAKNLTSNWKPQEARRNKQKPVFTPNQKKFTRPNLNMGHLMFVSPSASVQDELRYAVAIWTIIFGDDTGSKLFWELIETGLVESAYSWSDDKDEVGKLVTYVTAEEKNLEVVKTKLQTLYKQALDFTDEELNSAKIKLASRISINSELSLSRMFALGESYLTRKELLSSPEVVAKILKVTRKDIESYFIKYPLSSYSEYLMVNE